MTDSGFRFPASGPRLVVYTDLDGTLLDHHNYDWQAAQPALEQLAKLSAPVVPITSKTIAELWGLRARLGLDGPFAVENGGAIVVPAHYFGANRGVALDDAPTPGYFAEILGIDYQRILAVLANLRGEGFRFQGFADMSVDEVCRHTGLTPEQATLARVRLCSEPLVWEGDLASLEHFKSRLVDEDLSYKQGGRFLHVLGRCDKGGALTRLQERFARNAVTQGGPPLACALGDSPNDFDMLRAADRAALVQRPDGSYAAPAEPPITHAVGQGPVGWCNAVQRWLADLD